MTERAWSITHIYWLNFKVRSILLVSGKHLTNKRRVICSISVREKKAGNDLFLVSFFSFLALKSATSRKPGLIITGCAVVWYKCGIYWLKMSCGKSCVVVFYLQVVMERLTIIVANQKVRKAIDYVRAILNKIRFSLFAESLRRLSPSFISGIWQFGVLLL